MRFNFLVVAVALQGLVSSLPIEVRSDVDILSDLVTRDDNWALSIRKHDFPKFHWGLYIHPAASHSGGFICEAKSSKTHTPGVSHLETKCFADTRSGDPVTFTLLGPIAKGKHDEAKTLLQGVHSATPTENCVDYTLKGGKVLHDHKIIADAAWHKLEQEYNANEAEIRKETAVHFTKTKTSTKPHKK